MEKGDQLCSGYNEKVSIMIYHNTKVGRIN
jgi:hypothetical protein